MIGSSSRLRNMMRYSRRIRIFISFKTSENEFKEHYYRRIQVDTTTVKFMVQEATMEVYSRAVIWTLGSVI